MITNYTLASFSFIWCFKIFRLIVIGRTKLYPYCVVLLAISQAALIGGTYHGFGQFFPLVVQIFVWKLVLGFIGIAAFFLLVILIQRLSLKLRLVLNSIFIVMYFGTMFFSNNFLFSVVCYLSVVLVALLVSLRRKSTYMVLFSVLSFVAAWFQISGLKLHIYFTGDNIYHLVQAIGCYYFYKHAMSVRGSDAMA